MTPHLLILGGTTEATALARAVAEAGLRAVFSYAGRVDRPRAQPVPVRVGGFGGADGLARYLRAEAITHVVDATHPFAAQMSTNAVVACAMADVPLIALTRPAWQAGPQDRWTVVPDIDAAVAALAGPVRRVFLAVGRMHLAAFAAQPQHRYLLRLVDQPDALPLPDCHLVVDRGPFSAEADKALMQDHGIELVVSKNAGGTGARSKIDAAREMGLPVLMIDRPPIPPRTEVQTPAQVISWLAHSGVDLGV
ncbi:cobalt-precorrin-6A reductase [Sedimentitalea todarodis]|uniref:Cobalt-precorrin-6A reductase n=1 Tax=Sedimentitalea todarodis TaxID=1631240 RepID=A0ABU3VJ18_9RHOB|nr:cobalt-precorrin-6A reductase [Sedimentitalea todarodis]MDU9005699.1 cobalt-precorrin-6A reductase [Sedimentitalea todarodis]